jgi:hypothetical protein
VIDDEEGGNFRIIFPYAPNRRYGGARRKLEARLAPLGEK